MHRFILIAAVLLTSASAWADGPRGLSLASNDEAVAAEQPKAAEPREEQLQKAEAPKVVELPSDVAPQPTKADQLKPDRTRLDHTKSVSRKSEKPKFKRSPLEARVVDELHRHGIYW